MMIELPFNLDVEDDWPPVAVEALPCELIGDEYRILAAPLFIKNLSVGDVIAVTLGSAGHVESWQHVAKSARSTLWLLRIAKTDEIPRLLDCLRALGCDTVRLEQFGIYSVDIPESRPIRDVDLCLAAADPERVAISFASFRHEEDGASEA